MSDKYAIIKLGGKQFKVTEGLKLKLEAQEKLDISVLAYSDGKKLKVGEPTLKDVTVKAKVILEGKSPKIRVARFKSKSRYRKVKGHSQPNITVEIQEIISGTKKVSKKPETSTKKKTVKKVKGK